MMLSQDQILRIQNVPDFARNTDYNQIDIAGTFQYWGRRYIDTVSIYADIRECTLCDCGSGFGWLSFAYLLKGGKSAILVDTNASKLQAARDIATVLDVASRCQFLQAPLEALPLADQQVDIFASIETLEHVGRQNIKSCVANMVRTTSKVIVMTTPNRAFPLDIHDTELPFAHWLPKRARAEYSRLAGRDCTDFNDFLGPWDLLPLLRAFRPVSKVLTFGSIADWIASYPFFSPYAGGRLKVRPPGVLKIYYAITAAALGRYSFLLNPNLCSVWVRRPHRSPARP